MTANAGNELTLTGSEIQIADVPFNDFVAFCQTNQVISVGVKDGHYRVAFRHENTPENNLEKGVDSSEQKLV